MPMTRVYEEISDFVAAGNSPRDVVAYQPSEAAKARVTDLNPAGKNDRPVDRRNR